MPDELSIELSWEEVRLAIEGHQQLTISSLLPTFLTIGSLSPHCVGSGVGFEICLEEFDHECKYTVNQESLQYTLYRCIHFVAQKPVNQ